MHQKVIIEGKLIKVFNHGKMERDCTYVDDIDLKKFVDWYKDYYKIYVVKKAPFWVRYRRRSRHRVRNVIKLICK